MKKNNLHVAVPDILLLAHRQGSILSVVLFGSSLYSYDPKDVDLAVVTAPGRFDEFVNLLIGDDSLLKYDISLIKSEEIDYNKRFYFGGHGQYLVESFRKGRVLVGKNLFENYHLTTVKDIKSSIFDRMKEYIYILRKGYFDKIAENKFYSRYNKMLKLSAFLLTDEYVFPEVLSSDIETVRGSLVETGCVFTDDKKRNIENLWIKINERYL